jgi:4-amino-4-deoxy-L-arabinose transferase-like glycosyltransferase
MTTVAPARERPDDGAPPPRRRTVAVALALILLVAAGLRLHRIGEHSLWLDEVLSVEASRDLGRALTAYTHPPLPYLALHLWARAFGDSDAALRSLSAVFGTLAVLAAFLVARRLFASAPVALTAAALLAVMPEALRQSREVRHYAMWPALTLLAFWALLAHRRGPARRVHTLAYWGCTAAALLTHYYAIFYAAALAAAGLLLIGDHPWRKTRAELGRWLTLHVPLVAAGAALVAYRLALWSGAASLASARARPGTLGRVFWWLGGMVFARPWAYPDPPRVAALAGVGLAVLLALAAALMLRDRRVDRGAAWALLVVLWVPFVAIELFPIKSYPRLMAPTLPIVVLGLAYLAWAPLPWRLLSAVRLALAAAFLVRLAPYGLDVYRLEIEPWKTVCAATAGTAHGRDVVLVNEPYMRKPLRRCYRGRAAVIGFPDPRRELRAETVARFAADHATVWLVYAHAWRSDPRRAGVRALLESHELVEHRRLSPVLEVFRLERR